MRVIIWSGKAMDDYLENIDYLEKNWTELEIKNFIAKTDDVLGKLKMDNIRFLSTGYRDTFRVPITKHVTLFYMLRENEVILLRFWNNYQNPDVFSTE